MLNDVEDALIPVYIMGKRYEVPTSLTIMKAMEWAGYTLVRGAGCRGGFCGACATVYRVGGDERLHFGLACQTVVRPDMYLAQIPFFPAQRRTYDLTRLKAEPVTVWKLYPEVLHCLGCGTCTKSCPQELDVKGYMAALMRGNISAAADRSFDCIMCGLCAARCPAEESQYNAAILARRLFGRYLAPRSRHLAERLAELESGAFKDEIAALKQADRATLLKLYAARDIEPE